MGVVAGMECLESRSIWNQEALAQARNRQALSRAQLPATLRSLNIWNDTWAPSGCPAVRSPAFTALCDALRRRCRQVQDVQRTLRWHHHPLGTWPP